MIARQTSARARKIETVKDYARRGGTSAAATFRPWVACVDGKRLVDRRGNPRRFSTEDAAIAAARRSP